ncbi:MAG: dicarboxylate/amino acid:cation symporter [Cellvibrio sp.]|uniref:dicarboxylate/amino acid:cation symporter n=1 Tax=Cellvibrio sp. TaxID=1965322 RepID=UPI0031B43B1A
MSLTNKILLGMVLGVIVGIVFNLLLGGAHSPPTQGVGLVVKTYLIDGLFDIVGQIFISSLKLLVVPLVFVSLVCGAAALGGQSRMGALAGKTLGLYICCTSFAVALSIACAVFIQPGAEVNIPTSSNFTAPEIPSIKQTLIDIVPSNPLQSMVETNMLQIIIFSILFGIAISRTGGEASANLMTFFNNLNDVIIKMVMMLMQLAPYGVFCLLAKLFSTLGVGVIIDLAKYFFTVVFVLFLHGIGVYGALIKILSGLNPIIFFKKMQKVMLFAFSTASSNATIPITLRTVEHDLGVDNKVASFSIPLGATVNMDGTAIMQGVATVFIAQAYGIDIGIAGYLMVVLTATLASIGTAGVPGVGLVTLTMVLQSVGLPVEGIALIIGVDRLLDMIRTGVNVAGDAVVAVIVAKSEKMLDIERYNNPSLNVENEKA